MKKIHTILICLLAYTVSANTIIVENTNDSGPQSLRQAVIDATLNDTIRFNSSLISTGSATITLESEIAFSKSLVFIGLYNSTDTLYISGGNTNRHFNISNTGNLTLDSMVLVNGLSAGGSGGAISIIDSDTLFVYNTIILNNNADRAGGIYSYSSSSVIIVENSMIQSNETSITSSASNGGGIFSSGYSGPSFVKILNSTISGNSSHDYGGGIYSISTISSTVEVENSTISENSTIEYGGGIYSTSYSATSIFSLVTVLKSTINGNVVGKNGGGIYSYSASGTSLVSLEYTTLYGNSNNNSITSYGGGIYSLSSNSTSTVQVLGSIISTLENSGTNIFSNGNTTVTSLGYNIFSDAPLGSIASDSINVSSSSLNLQPLAFNGGTTQTMLPGIGSIAINGGSADLSDAQNRIVVGRRDIGAAEYFCEASGGTDVQTACGSFVWIDGITYTTDNSVATHTKMNNIDGACDTLFTLDLTINPAVDITTTQSGITLTANASAATYQWLDCDNANAPIVGATNQTFTATTNGNYAVEVTQNGCSDTSACIAVNTVGLNNNELAGVNIYPNPTSDIVKVSFDNMQEGQHTLEVLDATGRVLNSQKINNNSTLVNLSNYGRGLYLIRISNGKNQSVHRVIKK